VPGLYLHIPYCERKCLYCDFYSVESTSSLADFLRCLSLEIEQHAQFGKQAQPFETVYFGGGTPSLLPARSLEEILDKLQRTFPIPPTAEITLEANPGTVDLAKLKEFRRAGINRLSIGIQSFRDDELRFLGRIHSGREAMECVSLARGAGIDNISLDLIFALPNQTLKAWKENLETAVSLEPQHISAYSLIVEEGTPLYRMVGRGEVTPAPEELESEMYLLTMEYLASQGFEHYEVSNYAKPGYRSRHNSLYWNHEPYLGFGPSAHSFWSGEPLSEPTRWWNVASVGKYCKSISQGQRPVEGEEHLSSVHLLTEEIFLGLRTGGINVRKLQRDYGANLVEQHGQKLERFLRERLVTVEGETIRLTSRGFLYCDEIALELVP